MKKKCTIVDNLDMYKMTVSIFALRNISKRAKLSDADIKEVNDIKAVIKKAKCKRLYPNVLIENVSKLCSHYDIDSISYIEKVTNVTCCASFTFTTHDRHDFMLYLGALDALINGKQPTLGDVMDDETFYKKYGAKVILRDEEIPNADEWEKAFKAFFA